MPAPISVIIPTLNAATGLVRTSVSLAEGLDAGLIRELIVSDGGSTDGTLEIADELGAQVVEGPYTLASRIGRGVSAARGEWLLILIAGTELEPGWGDAVRAHLAQNKKGAFFRLRYRTTGIAPAMVAAWINFRSRFLGLACSHQGLLVRSDVLNQVGSAPDITAVEDAALARRLRGNLVMLPVVAMTSAGIFRRTG